MLQTFSRRALFSVVALSLAAGCSSSSGTTGSASLTPATHRVGGAVRYVPGPVVSGPIAIPLVRTKTNAPVGWPDRKKKGKSILFVADCSAGILMYDPANANSGPTGSITDGTNCPFGVAVDKKETLYVANIGNSTVTIYPKGSSSPSTTLTSGISSPYSVAVDSKGNLFVSNLGNNTITAYASGQTSAFETINFNAYGQAVGIGVDKSNNIWVVLRYHQRRLRNQSRFANPYEHRNGGLVRPDRHLVRSEGRDLRLELRGEAVQVYKYGTTLPFEAIQSGIISGPTQNGITRNDTFFQSNQDVNVVGYKKGQTTPFSTLTGTSSPAQITSWPLVKK